MIAQALPFVEEAGELSQVDKWKLELTEHLSLCGKAIESYQKGVSALESFIHFNAERIYPCTTIESIMSQWVLKQCELANTRAQNASHLLITPDRLPSDLRRFSPSDCEWNKEILKELGFRYPTDATFAQLSQFMLRTFDFAGLEAALSRAEKKIEAEGFKDAAKSLASNFGLSVRCRREFVELRKQKGRVILESSHYGSYSYDRAKSLNKFKDFAGSFEAEAGVGGLCQALALAIDAERSTSGLSNSGVASRTKVGAGGNVEIVFFNDKLKFYFMPEIFEALVGFIKAYSIDPICELVIK